MNRDIVVTKYFAALLCVFLFLTPFVPAKAQQPSQSLPEKTRILFLLDGSGSMLARWENTLRINVAKTFLAGFVDSLRVNENLELALRVYGHQYDRRYHKCNDTKLEVPFGKNNHDDIIQTLRLIQPKGTTPIAYSLQQAAGDFPQDKNYRNIIIIITDGVESCDGDPCAVSLSLQKKGIFLQPFIIGIGMEEDYKDAFGCMGQYYDAANINEFRRALSKALTQSLGETTVSVELLDAGGRPDETDVNVSFINSFTQISAFEFVHYLDKSGKPDSVEVDPVLSYDVVVNTIPQVVKKKINFEGGKHHVLPIKVPQGVLKVDFPGAVSYEGGVQCLVKNRQTGQTYTYFPANSSVKLLAGQYDIEVLTLPSELYKNVKIEPEKVRHISIDKPGMVNLISSSKGIGSIYQLDDEGRQRWVYNLRRDETHHTINLQPGNYKVVFRSDWAKGSKFTKINHFSVAPGASLTIRL